MSLHHAFSVELAEKYGIECAILIHHFQFWIEQNQSLGRNFHDGRTWMYQTQKEISAVYPYMSEDAVNRTIKKLLEEKVLIKGNYNKTPFDKTAWYAFENEEMFTKPRNRGIGAAESRNPDRAIAEPIPDTKTYTKQKQQQQAAKPAADSSEKNPKQQQASQEKETFLPPKKIHPLLEKLSIPDNEKRWISEHYKEDEIRDAVAWATHPDTKIKSTLEQAIKWASTNKPAVPAMPENNKEYAQLISKKILLPKHLQGVFQFEILSGHVEINCGYHAIVIAYAEKGFKDQLINALRKTGARIE